MSHQNLTQLTVTPELVSLLEQFMSDPPAGKYSRPGYPHKLGLLLHGKPGTGKTRYTGIEFMLSITHPNLRT